MTRQPKMKGVAVIGMGGMGRFHAETLRAIPGVGLAAVCDPLESSARTAAEEFGAPWNLDPMAVASGGFDGVVIASPDHTHAELTAAAINAGSRVLCEKPLSHDLAGAEDILAMEEALGRRVVQVGFMREYDPAHASLANALGSGPLHYLRCTHRNTNVDARPPEIVMTQSVIHDIHTVHWLTGSSVTEVAARVHERPGGLDHVLLVLTLSTGATAAIEFSDRGYAYEVEVEATIPGGRVTMAQPQQTFVRHEGDVRRTVGTDWFDRFAEAYRVEDRIWADSLREPAAVGPSAWDGLRAQDVAEAALASISSGAPVAVGERARPEIYRSAERNTP